MFTTKNRLKAKFIVIKAQSSGFYVLAFKSPAEFYDQYFPVFEAVARSFKIGDECCPDIN